VAPEPGRDTTGPNTHREDNRLIFQPGQRVELVHTSDPHTRLRYGARGSVVRHNSATGTVDITWDDGSRLSMCPDTGDHIRLLDQIQAAEESWAHLLDLVGEHAARAGRAAADQWARQNLGAHATGDVKANAQLVLAGLRAGEYAALNALPATGLAAARGRAPADERRYLDLAGHDAPAWQTLASIQRAELLEIFHDSLLTAAGDRVAEHCRVVLSPTGDGADLSHLHPSQLRIGGVGVFTEWPPLLPAAGEPRTLTGYVGTLVDRRNGWPVFTLTRPVAEAVVADRQRLRAESRHRLAAAGVPADQLDQTVNQELAVLVFDGDTLVADRRGPRDGPRAVERIIPDTEGRYTVMGARWCWMAVDPYDCDRIVGEPPDPPAGA
jgi:hypothetical protein